MGGHSRIHTHTKYICEQHPCFGFKVLLLIAACGHHDPTCLDSFTGAKQCAVVPTCSSKKDAEDQSSVISRNSRLPLAILYCWKVPAAHRIQTWETLVDKKLLLRFSPMVCSSLLLCKTILISCKQKNAPTGWIQEHSAFCSFRLVSVMWHDRLYKYCCL